MHIFTETLRGHLTQSDKQRSDYVYLPFVLPNAAKRLHVRYEYSARMTADKTHGGNVIDIGLFDPRGHDFPGGAGFRGWSGSARQEFTIAPDRATPGYLPGPLPPGQYHVVLGLYRIWPDGADYEIRVEADLVDADSVDAEQTTGPPGPAPPSGSERDTEARRPAELDTPTMWLCGDLQSHTYHSDAKGSPEQLVSKAADLQLDFLAITDHNTVSHHAELPGLSSSAVLLLRGQEVTTYYGHMNVWGTGTWCDFRCSSKEELGQVIALAHSHGGVCSINHPKTGGPPWQYGADVGVQAIEVWQGPWPHRNRESFDLWDSLLSGGRRIPAVGGSDYHCPRGAETSMLRLGQPTTWVKATGRSEDAILAAICAGRTCISARRDGPRLDIWAQQAGRRVEMGDELGVRDDGPVQLGVEVTGGSGLRLDVISDGRVVYETDIDADHEEVHVAVSCRTYVRAELVGDAPAHLLPPEAPAGLDLTGWRWAITNPIYIRA